MCNLTLTPHYGCHREGMTCYWASGGGMCNLTLTPHYVCHREGMTCC